MTAIDNEELIKTSAKWIAQLAHKPPCCFSELVSHTLDCDWCKRNCATATTRQCWINAITHNWLDDVPATEEEDFWINYFKSDNPYDEGWNNIFFND